MCLIYILSFCIVHSITCAAPSPFTVPVDQKQASKGALKEECNDLLLEVLKLTPSISMRNARMQELGLELVPAMIDGSFFSGMNKTELDACCKELHGLMLRQEKINALLEEQCLTLRNLKKKS